MSNITRFNPFNDVARFEPFMDVDEFFNGFPLRSFKREFENELQMKNDASEANGLYKIKAEIPGVNKNDIQVSVDGNLVSITAEMKKVKEEKPDEKVIHCERYYGSISRSFTLSSEVDPDKTQARYADGVLELTLPKKPNGYKTSINIF